MSKPPKESSTQSQPQEKWKEFHTEMVGKMRIEKLSEAMKRCEREALETAIMEAKEAGVSSNHETLLRAQAELELVGVRQQLRDAVATKNPDTIREVMGNIRSNSDHNSRLLPDMSDAQRKLERIERMLRLGSYILDMDRKTMGEMRRYHHPPSVVHKVMQAALLLFKEDEENSMKWSLCQNYLQPNGVHGMNRRVLDFDPSTVNPEIAARVCQILDIYQLTDIQKVSPGAATFYVWTKGVIQNISMTNTKPADIKRQKEIFTPAPPESPRRRRKMFLGEPDSSR